MHSISLQRKFKRRRKIVTRIEVSKEKKSKLTENCNFTYLDSVMPYLQLNLNLLNKLGFTVRGMFFFIEMLKQIHIFT